MSINNLHDQPTAKWSLERLGQYCKEKSDRMAVDAWLTGKAMAIAKNKTKHGGFTAWKRKWGYSDAMVSRYTRLFEKHKTPDKLNGIGIMEALCEADIHRKPTTTPQKAVLAARLAAPSQAMRPKAPPSAPYPWAEPDTSGFEALEPADADEEPIDDEAVLAADIAGLPMSCQTLTRQIDVIVGRDKTLRAKAWPNDQTEAIKTAVADLKKALADLEKVIPS